MDKVVKLIGGGSVINGAYPSTPSSFYSDAVIVKLQILKFLKEITLHTSECDIVLGVQLHRY